MNEDFQNIYQKLSELLREFTRIQTSTNTVRQALRGIAETLQREANLYEVHLEMFEGGFRIHDSVFGNKEDVQVFLCHLPPPKPLYNTETVRKILNGEIVISSNEQEANPTYFYGTPFPLTASCVFLPIKRKGEIFGVLSLGSTKIISPANYSEGSSESRTFRVPLENILAKINQIADSKGEIG